MLKLSSRISKNKLIIIAISFLILGLVFFLFAKVKKTSIKNSTKISIEDNPQSLMILIEYKDTVGLINFVNEMEKRNIPGLLHVSADFVEENCETINELLKHNIEIMASISEPLWDMSYEDQLEIISDTKTRIEACTNTPIKIISSSYMASGMTTLAVAEELGIPYITARGTTDTKATVYQVEGYQTKILSVSNIPKVQFKYGSLCDYSYYQRSGSPDDMLAELNRALEPLTDKEKERYGVYHKITPVTHTNIGGYLQPWLDMWLNFFDTNTDKIDWVDLDTFMSSVDWTLPDWQIPINQNAPYTPEKIRPATSYEDVDKVDNPCLVEDLSNNDVQSSPTESLKQEDKVIIFHNGQGEMCLDALEFFADNNIEYVEHLNTDDDFQELLNSYQQNYSSSKGVSDNYEYFPIIFYNGTAYSGFTQEIKNEILNN